MAGYNLLAPGIQKQLAVGLYLWLVGLWVPRNLDVTFVVLVVDILVIVIVVIVCFDVWLHNVSESVNL